MRLTSKIAGLSKTQVRLRIYAAELRTGGRKLNERAARNGVRFAKRRVPLGDTGDLQASIKSRFFDRGLTYEIIADKEYAIYAEFQKRGADGQDREENRRLWLTATFKRQNKFLRRQLRKLAKEISARRAGPL
tara:strand:+ start:893 stop:1291 length:399 start_codon:yes stop_codon:yes gene_type:complete